jgi:hypothetical protein
MSRLNAIFGFGLVGLLAWPAAAVAQVQVNAAISPNPDGGNPSSAVAVTACNGAPQTGVLYRNSEAEPHLAVNPANPANMIVGWHQDRWSTGGAQSIGAAFTVNGGVSWSQVVIPFTRCAGATAGSAGSYERASDPWITFSPNGTAHMMALGLDNSVNENGQLVSRSTNGGQTWSKPIVIWRSPAQDPTLVSLVHDKNSITADPRNSNLVYAGWTVFRLGTVSLVFSRSTDGGVTWSPPSPIATMGKVSASERAVFRQGTQIVVLPDGTLVNAFFRNVYDPANGTFGSEQAILRSFDQGKHWSRVDTVVAPFQQITALDEELGVPLRDAAGLPSIAVNRSTGQLYVAWQAHDPDSQARVDVFVARSDDRGSTWSAPVNVKLQPNAVQTFLPQVAVNDFGIVGVMFYDFRNDQLGDKVLSTDVFLASFTPQLVRIDEARLTSASFDFRQMAITGSRGYFAGDYMGLASAGAPFAAAFTMSNNLGLPVIYPQNNNGLFLDTNDRQNIVFVRH